MPSDYNKSVLRECAKDGLPKELYPDYRKCLSGLAKRLRLVYEQLLEGDTNGKITKKTVAELVMENWIKEKMLCKQYERYCGLMKQQGRQSLEKSHYFNKNRGVNSIYDRYKYIESSGIKIGSSVRCKKNDSQKTFLVIGISIDCTLIFKQCNGKRLSNQEPTAYEVA